MATITVNLVTVTPSYTTTNRANNNNIAGNPLIVYDPINPPIPEGNTGSESPLCATLQIQNAGGPRLPLRFAGSFAGISSLTHGYVFALVCDTIEVFRAPIIAAPPPGVSNFVIPFALMDWQPALRPRFPCRLAGQWFGRIYQPDGTSESHRHVLA